MPNNKPAKPNDLTFGELRLATMLCVASRIPDALSKNNAPPPDYTKILLTQDIPGIKKMVSEMVIQADRIAHAKGVDLAEAVRERLDPAKTGAAFNMRVRGFPAPAPAPAPTPAKAEGDN